MGLFDRLRGELIDIIEWLDGSDDTLVYRFDRYKNEIKNGAKLIVREGQAAVFINQGRIADVFAPGMYSLTTDNLPILSTLEGFKYGFNSPFKAEVYFINTRNYTTQKWGTKNPIVLSDPRFGMTEVRAYGSYVLRVSDPVVFIKQVVGTDGNFTMGKIADQLRSIIVSRFTDAAGEANITIEKFASQTTEIAELVHVILGKEFEKFGVELMSFLIENVSMPEKVKEELFELSRLNAVDLNKFSQMKAAKAMQSVAENGNTSTGLGMEFAMANMMGQIFSGANQQQGNTTSRTFHHATTTPPPLPNMVVFYAVVNGQQAGPYDINALKQLAVQRQITTDTLVWREGMENWLPASQSPELKSVFGAVPPPLPGL
ncbi:SPFH domain-containing protein [Pedobacter sp. AW31-3R]|uniref:SPFH domain-containing protein n=1 Tax=Pedobacter sp. AW31-3R TaxID=3445781 RepID=UPI003FA10D7D